MSPPAPDPSAFSDAASPAPSRLAALLMAQGMSRADVDKIEAATAAIWKAAICSTSSSLFRQLLEGELDGTEGLALARARGFHDHCAALPAAAKKRLAELMQKASGCRKPSKLGALMSEAVGLGGPFGADVAACFLDSIALRMASDERLDAAARAPLVAIAARHARGAHPLLLSSALGRACFASNPGLLRELISHGVDAFGPDCNGHAPLSLACRQIRGDRSLGADCARQLLAAGACLDDRDNHGDGPLLLAARNKLAEACHVLLDAGADPFEPSPRGPASALMDFDPALAARVEALALERDLARDTAKPADARSRPAPRI